MIVQVGDPVLRRTCKAVLKKEFNTAPLRTLLSRMQKELSGEENGVAIAAPQVGAAQRIFVVAGRVFLPEDAPEDTPAPSDKVFINPELTRLSRSVREMSEGCLSVHGKYGTVLRHEKATVKAFDEQGAPFTYHGTGLLAHIFQHECDHLEGVLYVDKALRLEDESAREDLREKFPA